MTTAAEDRARYGRLCGGLGWTEAEIDEKYAEHCEATRRVFSYRKWCDYWQYNKPRMRCYECGNVLLSNAVPQDQEALQYVHPACYRPIEESWRGMMDSDLFEAARELGILL